MITVITPTGDRQECLTLLSKYISRQTFKGPVQWILIDDGKTPFCPDLNILPKNIQVDYSTRYEPGVSGGSLNRNVIHALRKVKFDNVVFMEDDDWYAPTYLSVMLDMLSSHDIVGEGTPIYYNVKTRKYRRMPNREHASLAQTGFRREIIDTIDSCCRIPTPYIDRKIWSVNKTKSGRPLKKKVFFNHDLCVSIKSMPGRTGITLQHTEKQNLGTCDKNLKALQRYLGSDSSIYAPYYTPDVFSKIVSGPKPFLILGKGPSFSRIQNLEDYTTIGLNHVVERVPVDFAHIIDIDVVRDLGDKLLDAKFVIIPQNPHVNNRATDRTLSSFFRDYPVLKTLGEQERLLSYYASTWRASPRNANVVPVRYFSSEAAFNILAMSGIKVVHFAGVDGGTSYAPEFSHLTPLTNGRNDFNAQFQQIRNYADKYKVTLVGLPDVP